MADADGAVPAWVHHQLSLATVGQRLHHCRGDFHLGQVRGAVSHRMSINAFDARLLRAGGDDMNTNCVIVALLSPL